MDRKVLTIAGSDSGGGAGIQADLKTFLAHGVYGCSAITALTAQNTRGVDGVEPVSPDFVRKQITSVLQDFSVHAVKTGMLVSAETVEVVADCIQRFHLDRTVVDPVMVATSGATLLDESSVRSYIDRLLPLTYVLTPNIPEAIKLLQQAGESFDQPENIRDLALLARRVQRLGPKYVVLKGGHLPLQQDQNVAGQETERHTVVDILYDGETVVEFSHPYFQSKSTHGTGCSLASSIAANLALGLDMVTSVQEAIAYVHGAIAEACPVGGGHGPIHHGHRLQVLPFAKGRFIEYLLQRPDVQSVWKQYTHHPFVLAIADGSLDVNLFKYYLQQDYLFLIQFARSNGLAAYKSGSIKDISRSASIIMHLEREMSLHIGYCAGFGISLEQLNGGQESRACTAYTRYVLDVGMSQGLAALQVAMLPCLLGYGMIARRLHADRATKVDDNVFYKWIQNYVTEDYEQAVQAGRRTIEDHAWQRSPSDIEALVAIFKQATTLERDFWPTQLPPPSP